MGLTHKTLLCLFGLLHCSLSQNVVVAYASVNPEDLVYVTWGTEDDIVDKGTAGKDSTLF